ncbi:MAG TPA: hypothetical protein EYH42_09970 [Sulfurovum sp.]|nr:hypothetical protein [Sulfurovum sp.]
MKKASTILSHLTNQPQFRYLKKQICYTKYIKLLGKKYQKAIAFVYIKNNILYIAVTHPGFKMELNYNKDVLKTVFTQFTNHDNECNMMQADQVVIFHSKYHPIRREKEKRITVPYYTELSSSDFNIESKDEEIIKKFEQTKKHIKCNQ